jgi:prophage antirepressor-like protein
MKKNPTSPKLSVTESAWAAFFEEQKVDDLDTLRAEGWMTVADVATALGRTYASADRLLRGSGNFERREVQADPGSGKVRRMNVFRPKLGVEYPADNR